MDERDILAQKDFEEFLNVAMMGCDIDEWRQASFAKRLLEAGLASSNESARLGGLRAIKYLLLNGYQEAFSEPGPIRTRRLLAESPEDAYRIIEDGWEEGSWFPSTLMVWFYPTEIGLKWRQDLKDKGWIPPERYTRV